MQDKSYMGRIFLAPKGNSPPGVSSVYINIGWNTRGGQLYPDYASETILHEICEERQYNELVDKLKSYLDSQAISFRCKICLVMCLPCSLPCCLITMSRARRVTSGMKGIVADHGSWRYPIRLELTELGMTVAQTEQAMGYDQIGNVLMDAGRERGPQPIWPPLGYNIIVDITDSGDLHRRWPRKSGDRLQRIEYGGGNYYPGASAPSAQDPMNRYMGSTDARVHLGGDASGGHITAELQKLNDLKMQGILSDAEFEAAKAKVLSS